MEAVVSAPAQQIAAQHAKAKVGKRVDCIVLLRKLAEKKIV